MANLNCMVTILPRLHEMMAIDEYEMQQPYKIAEWLKKKRLFNTERNTEKSDIKVVQPGCRSFCI